MFNPMVTNTNRLLGKGKKNYNEIHETKHTLTNTNTESQKGLKSSTTANPIILNVRIFFSLDLFIL